LYKQKDGPLRKKKKKLFFFWVWGGFLDNIFYVALEQQQLAGKRS
jgi:hypothetical protein